MPEDVNNAWHVAGRSQELTDRPLGRRLLDRPLVLFRDTEGQAVALLDRCPHGLGPLSTGHVSGDVLVCAYHGLRVDKRGECVDSRLSSSARSAAKVDNFAVEERDGCLWIWMGDQARADPTLIEASAAPED